MDDEDTQDGHVCFCEFILSQVDELLEIVENELIISGISYNVSKLNEKINNEKSEGKLSFSQIV